MTTTERIAKLADEAAEAGDSGMVEACRLALYEDDEAALVECLAVLRERENSSIDVEEWCERAHCGDYLSTFWDGERDPGSRCGWPDSTLATIRRKLARMDLALRADDRGLVVAMLGEEE